MKKKKNENAAVDVEVVAQDHNKSQSDEVNNNLADYGFVKKFQDEIKHLKKSNAALRGENGRYRRCVDEYRNKFNDLQQNVKDLETKIDWYYEENSRLAQQVAYYKKPWYKRIFRKC